ncbi:hypothetical protein PFFCH_01231 [Plasmodium falciparum FCH/4]|uniref:Myb-like domain-containing protein n=1 Tax=Plasmodium falciparum FCH/4 TaxID=1036724 RepID=A0A024VTX3_PLAFA|nr:hypothetical protein PFFCH_01231 [Plasmodium falciparum FCH/4]
MVTKVEQKKKKKKTKVKAYDIDESKKVFLYAYEYQLKNEKINWKRAEELKITKHSGSSMRSHYINTIKHEISLYLEMYPEEVAKLFVKVKQWKKKKKKKKLLAFQNNIVTQRSNISLNRITKCKSTNYNKFNSLVVSKSFSMKYKHIHTNNNNRSEKNNSAIKLNKSNNKEKNKHVHKKKIVHDSIDKNKSVNKKIGNDSINKNKNDNKKNVNEKINKNRNGTSNSTTKMSLKKNKGKHEKDTSNVMNITTRSSGDTTSNNNNTNSTNKSNIVTKNKKVNKKKKKKESKNDIKVIKNTIEKTNKNINNSFNIDRMEEAVDNNNKCNEKDNKDIFIGSQTNENIKKNVQFVKEEDILKIKLEQIKINQKKKNISKNNDNWKKLLLQTNYTNDERESKVIAENKKPYTNYVTNNAVPTLNMNKINTINNKINQMS